MSVRFQYTNHIAVRHALTRMASMHWWPSFVIFSHRAANLTPRRDANSHTNTSALKRSFAKIHCASCQRDLPLLPQISSWTAT